jgi:hypothetical protein
MIDAAVQSLVDMHRSRGDETGIKGAELHYSNRAIIIADFVNLSRAYG